MQHHQRAEKSESPRSHAQNEFPQFAIKDDRALPTSLFRDEFKFENSTNPASMTNASRLINWVTGLGQSPLVVTGAHGIGKSILAWQVMSEADSRGLVPILVGASDLVMKNDHERPEEFGRRALPRTSIKVFESVLSRLSELKEAGRDHSRSMLVIIDGVDPDHYSPLVHRGGNRMLQSIQALNIPVILTVDSDRQVLKGGSLDGYQRILNPAGLATSGIVLGRDLAGTKTLSREDIVFPR